MATELARRVERLERLYRMMPATRTPAVIPEEIPEPDPAPIVPVIVAIEPEPEAAEQEPSFPTIRKIINAVCRRYGVTYIDMISMRRTQNLVRPRQVVMYLARTLTIHSLPAIGLRLGGRDHTTVLHGFRKIEALLPIDPDLRQVISELEVELAAKAKAIEETA